jgi:predicted phosphodiesterase
MTHQRILACGDNHGDAESLEKLVEATEGEEFDFIIHTGDITNAYKTDLETGVDQLQAVEPYFEILAERGTLVYIYGNRDKERAFGGSPTHVSEEYELSVGHRLQAGGELTVDGQRFTADPADADPEDILLTHGISQEAFFQSSANAYFCGDTHRARQFKTALNTGYLHNDKGFNGAYFTATLDDDELEVAVHGLDEQWKGFVCPDHQWYGRQFTPEKFGCGLCKFGPGRQFSSIAFIAFEKATSEEEETASIDDLVVAARDGVVDDGTFADQFRSYLEELANVDRPHPTDPLKPAESPESLKRQ